MEDKSIQTDNFGYVYCLTNQSMRNLVKVGYTIKQPEIRMKELYKTGVPINFNLQFAIRINNYSQTETIIHNMLKKYRYNKSREFFIRTPEEVYSIFQLFIGSGCIFYKKLNEPIISNDETYGYDIIETETYTKYINSDFYGNKCYLKLKSSDLNLDEVIKICKANNICCFAEWSGKYYLRPKEITKQNILNKMKKNIGKDRKGHFGRPVCFYLLK